ncbi:MAG: hypothetical protein HC910_04755 [Spirulinaceae cyanobacterium SM2_1_0]|nr:hypothetical protein [Spirulinaceae cyanobacterium SM2_1_0]
MRFIPLAIVFLLGSVGVVAFGFYALIDWVALEQSYANFAALAGSGSSLNALFAAEAQQNIHRLNLFAEGVWVLQSATLAAIALHGLCTVPRRRRN